MILSVHIKPLLALLAIVAIIGIGTALFRKSPNGAESEQVANRQLPQNIDVALKKARFSEMQDGVELWNLLAERVEYDKALDKAYLTDIDMEFQHTRLREAVKVTADSGEYSNTEKNVRLNGHVRAVTENGASFTTDTLIYNASTAQLSTVDTVTFRQEKLQLTAVGMNMGLKNQQAHFLSAVNASVVVH